MIWAITRLFLTFCMKHDLGNKSILPYILYENYAYSLNDILLFIYLFIIYLFIVDLQPKLSSMSISTEGNAFGFVGEMGLVFLLKPKHL